MQIIFVHGWSVTHTDTYGEMPRALSTIAAAYGLDIDIQHIYLGRYISFHDEVTVDDISRAMDSALRDLPGNSDTRISSFSCITHSTGGPVVRHWVDKYYGPGKLQELPLKHLVMLAPANHGSSLAVLGKARVSRIKSWFQGVEPGQRVLDWLCLGSEGQWALNKRYVSYRFASKDFYPFVLTGQGIDKNFYDFINSYLVEKGSDGVVRVAGANMNYRYFSLKQDINQPIAKKANTFALKPVGKMKKSSRMALGVYSQYSHSGGKMGILKSALPTQTDSPIVNDILKCFLVDSEDDYKQRTNELAQLSETEQAGSAKYCMLVVRVRDDVGNIIGQGDYDLFLLAGKTYNEDKLPAGFFMDRQMNAKTGSLVYYLNADKMSRIKDGLFGLRVVARPEKGFSYYRAAEFQSDGIAVETILAPNETTYVDIVLHRYVDKNVFLFGPATDAHKSFKRTKPSGKALLKD